MTRANEKPPGKRFPELEEHRLDTYYEYKGWNKYDIPARKTLQELDTGYVAKEVAENKSE